MTAPTTSLASVSLSSGRRPGPLRALLLGGLVVVLVLSSAGGAWGGNITGASAVPRGSAPTGGGATATAATPNSPGALTSAPGSTAVSSAFDQRVLETASSLKAVGVSPRDLRLPYVGRPAQMVDGVVVPGYASPPSNVSPSYSATPAPAGLAYYGENDTSGRVEATTVNASSVVGTVTVNQLNALYMDDLTPDMWGVQLNAVLAGVTLQGHRGYEFWVQNTVDYFQHNHTLALGEDTWNFSSASAFIPAGNSTILRHSPNGTNVEGLYIGEGPVLSAPLPFTLTLYLNSSVTADREQECWFNYSLVAGGVPPAHGNFDFVVFNSSNPQHPAGVTPAPFEATGTHLDPVGLPNDFEFDIGIGPYDGSTLDVLAANASATLDYCPISKASCNSTEFLSVPAAEDFGGETGETSTGLSIAYRGTTALATAGPFILRGLWGFTAAAGSAAGSTPVTNAITVSSAPDPSSTVPYVFVFLNGSTADNPRFEWTPDVPVWYLPPGTYQYEILLADYAEQTGNLTVGSTPTALTVTLPYHPSSGVYTPLWAFGNAQLAGISASGDGSVSNQYRLFHNPTSQCTECGTAKDGNLSSRFYSLNDFLFPSFMGIWLVGTSAYVDIDHPVSFCVFSMAWGPTPPLTQGPDFYLQVGFVSTHHVTLTNDTEAGGWPAMYEIGTLANLVDPAENPFPQANVMVWNSTDDLVMSNTFVPTWLVPANRGTCFGQGACPTVICTGCVSPDGLLLYGGRNNTIWGNTFEDPVAPHVVPPQTYAGLAEAESGDTIFNNNFSVDNPTVLLPFDIYNNSCPDGYAGDCAPPLPPTYSDRWNVPVLPARDVAATVNGFPLSGNILGTNCPTQGGNYWWDYGNTMNPSRVLPFTNVYDYLELLPAVHWAFAIRSSIQLGGDYDPLSYSASCGGGARSSTGYLAEVYTLVGAVVVGGAVAAAIVGIRHYLRPRPAPWIVPPRGAGAEAGAVRTEEWEFSLTVPTWRERLARRPFGFGLWAGVAILGAYVAAALSAMVLYWSSLDAVPVNQYWIPPFNPIAPSMAHPFGVLPGLGTDLFRALWQATPWDLGIVAGILGLDAVLGWVLGALAGMHEGGALDSVVMFLSDTLGAIPSVFLVVTLFAGLAAVAPSSVDLPVFILLFGLVIWPTTARTTRERARVVAREPFLESARASGAGRFYLFFRHILPNSVSPLLAQLPIDVAPIFFVLTIFPWFWDCAGPGGAKGTYYLIASLPPYSPLPAVNFPEWGNLLAVGTCEGLPISTVGTTYWWMVLFPLLAILLLGIGIALVCDGLDRRLTARRV